MLERKIILGLHDHKQSVARTIDLHVQDTGVLDAFDYLRPNVTVIVFVLPNHRRVVFEVQGKGVFFQGG